MKLRFAAVLLLASCGIKGPPRPPTDEPPAAAAPAPAPAAPAQAEPPASDGGTEEP